jgi:hypothetical protein
MAAKNGVARAAAPATNGKACAAPDVQTHSVPDVQAGRSNGQTHVAGAPSTSEREEASHRMQHSIAHLQSSAEYDWAAPAAERELALQRLADEQNAAKQADDGGIAQLVNEQSAAILAREQGESASAPPARASDASYLRDKQRAEARQGGAAQEEGSRGCSCSANADKRRVLAPPEARDTSSDTPVPVSAANQSAQHPSSKPTSSEAAGGQQQPGTAPHKHLSAAQPAESPYIDAKLHMAALPEPASASRPDHSDPTPGDALAIATPHELADAPVQEPTQTASAVEPPFIAEDRRKAAAAEGDVDMLEPGNEDVDIDALLEADDEMLEQLPQSLQRAVAQRRAELAQGADAVGSGALFEKQGSEAPDNTAAAAMPPPPPPARRTTANGSDTAAHGAVNGQQESAGADGDASKLSRKGGATVKESGASFQTKLAAAAAQAEKGKRPSEDCFKSAKRACFLGCPSQSHLTCAAHPCCWLLMLRCFASPE